MKSASERPNGVSSCDVITAAEAARAALAVQQTGSPISVVLLVTQDTPAARIILDSNGVACGSLGNSELDRIAIEIARESLDLNSMTGANATSRVVHVSDVAYTLYVETHTPVERLVVVGAGHIAVPLAALGVMLDFRVTVLDDREEFATDERFAEGVEVLQTDFVADPFANVVIDERTYVALVTRGHRWDFDCLTRLLDRPTLPRYIGMIGSRRRVRAAFEALTAANVDRERLGHIHAPIGIDIAAQTPAEIAISIAAELIAVRRSAATVSGREAAALSQQERVLERLLPNS